jgi:DNA (cytosine-5)-methyltransferase 1
MVNYSCSNCQKIFTQKGHYDKHLQRKRPCKKDNIIEKLVEEKVKEVLEKINVNKSLKIGTLFTGIGSFEHALQVQGRKNEIMFACDIDKYVKKSYFANYEIKEDRWYDDINKLDVKHLLSENIDFVVGGSPCQSFSTVGKQKGLEDFRGTLIFQFIRIITECQPKFFIFENVKGLKTHNKGKTFEIVLEEFKKTGYEIIYDVLNAKDYGVPQSRQRMFMIGKRYDFKTNIIFPPPKIDLTSTMKDYLEDNVDSKYSLNFKGQEFVTKEKNILKKYTQINGDIALCQKRNQQYNWFGDFVFEPKSIDEKYILSEKVQAYVLSTGTKTFKTSVEINLDIARPILSTVHKMHRAGIDNYVSVNKNRIRKLTPRECLRLMGFRDNFKIVVSDTRAYQQAGNSIVVDIFLHILSNISI